MSLDNLKKKTLSSLWAVVVVYCIIAILASLGIWRFAKWQVNQTRPETIQVRIEREFEVQKQLFGFANLLGSLAFGFTAYFAWQNLQLSRQQQSLSEDKQVAERFSKAVEMLGAQDNLEQRIGGIYALERLAIDSEKNYYWTVIEVITAFLRCKSPVFPNKETQDRINADIQIAFSTIFRLMPYRIDAQKEIDINLSNTNLRGAILTGKGNLNHIFFNQSCFDNAHLNSIEMSGACCYKATFQDADLVGGTFIATDFSKCKFQDAKLAKAKFKGAGFAAAEFTGTEVYEADFRSAQCLNVKQVKKDSKDGQYAIYS